MTHPRSLTALATLGVLATGPLTAQVWTQLQPTLSPTPRRAGAMAYEPGLGRLLLYGGLETPTAISGETWGLGAAPLFWNLFAVAPPPRWGHRMVYHRARGSLVTFGGRTPTITATGNDTWEWSNFAWQQVFPASSPSPRAFYSMAYDERREVVLMYGAQGGTTAAGGNQLWEYDFAGNWSLKTTATSPPGLETPLLVYDQGRGVTVMFGGWNGTSPGTMHSSTWEYDGTDWTLRTLATTPTARYRSAHWYDDLRGRVVMYGGFGNATALTDTWEYDGNDWTQVASVGPLRSTECIAAYDPWQRKALLFGGSGPAGTSQETWEYVGPMTAIFAPFGQGCPGSAGQTVLSGTPPRLGQQFQLTVTNLPAGAIGTFVVQGASNTEWNNTLFRLPLDLGFFGVNGCGLEVSPDVSLFLVGVGGSAVLSFAIPNDINLLGVRHYSQSLTPDALAPNGVGSVSNAGHAVVGN